MSIQSISDNELQNPDLKTMKKILYNIDYLNPRHNELLFNYFERGLPPDKLQFREHHLNHSFLQYAALKDNYDAVKYLAENGAMLTYPGGLSRSTALHRACMNHNEEIIMVLLKHGANVNIRDSAKITPLMSLITTAKYYDDARNPLRIERKKRLITILINHGANPYIGLFGYMNCFEVAYKYYGAEMYNFLMDEYNWYNRKNLLMFRLQRRKNNTHIQNTIERNSNQETPQWAKEAGITV